MVTKGAGFANFSRGVCWVVAFIWLVLAILSFTEDSANAALNGFLWLAGAIAFAMSAVYLGKNRGNSDGAE